MSDELYQELFGAQSTKVQVHHYKDKMDLKIQLVNKFELYGKLCELTFILNTDLGDTDEKHLKIVFEIIKDAYTVCSKADTNNIERIEDTLGLALNCINILMDCVLNRKKHNDMSQIDASIREFYEKFSEIN